jgi:probable HAF family extracellular repeat protein
MHTPRSLPRRSRPASGSFRPRLEALENRSLPSYTITGLGTLGGFVSVANGIDGDRIVGYSFTSAGKQHAFLYSNGVMQDLGTLGGANSQAFGVSGTAVVGWSDTASGARHAFLFQNGVMGDLGTLGGNFAEAFGIAGNFIVGDSLTPGLSDDPFLLRRNRTMMDLGTLGGTFGQAWGVNLFGEVVGQSTDLSGFTHAFHWRKGLMTDLGTLGGHTSVALAINNSGAIVGGADITSAGTDVQHAFLSDLNGMRDLGTLGGQVSQARALNQFNQVVGQSQFDPAKPNFHAFRYDESVDQMFDLQAEVANTGWLVTSAVGITDGGVIAGTGVSPGGTTEAFVMTPTGAANTPPGDGADASRLLAAGTVPGGTILLHGTAGSLASATGGGGGQRTVDRFGESGAPAHADAGFAVTVHQRGSDLVGEPGARVLSPVLVDAWFAELGPDAPFGDA